MAPTKISRGAAHKLARLVEQRSELHLLREGGLAALVATHNLNLREMQDFADTLLARNTTALAALGFEVT